MPEYRCRDCGEYFDEPHRYWETHGFTDGRYESWSECPYCGSPDYDFSYRVDQELAELAELEIDDEEVIE